MDPKVIKSRVFKIHLKNSIKKVAKSSRNGGPMLSQCSPERVSKKCQTNVIFFIAFGSQKESKMESNRQQSRSGESPGAQGVFERLRVASGAPFCEFFETFFADVVGCLFCTRLLKV